MHSHKHTQAFDCGGVQMVGARIWFASVCLESVCGVMRKERHTVARRDISVNRNQRSTSAMVASLAYGTIVILRFHQKLRTEAIFDERQC